MTEKTCQGPQNSSKIKHHSYSYSYSYTVQFYSDIKTESMTTIEKYIKSSVANHSQPGVQPDLAPSPTRP